MAPGLWPSRTFRLAMPVQNNHRAWKSYNNTIYRKVGVDIEAHRIYWTWPLSYGKMQCRLNDHHHHHHHFKMDLKHNVTLTGNSSNDINRHSHVRMSKGDKQKNYNEINLFSL